MAALFPFAFNHWFALTAAVLVALSESVKESFSLISPFLKETYPKQHDVNLIASFGLIGGYFALPAGFVCDNFGPGVTLLIGAILGLLGWLMVHSSLKSDEEELGSLCFLVRDCSVLSSVA